MNLLLRRLAILPLLLAPLAGPAARAQTHGLDGRVAPAPYLNGAFPAAAPTLPTSWSTVVAFPNLTFLNPVGLAPLPGTNRLVVWEREGRIYHFENNASTAAKTLVVDFSSVCQGWDDSGLLGVAFQSRFNLASPAASNRWMYVWYNHTRPGVAVAGSATTRPASTQDTINRLSRFTLDANGVAVAGSETVIIEQYDSSVWHNGGGMFFHPQNGFLYLTNGDDADTANSQRINTSLFSGVLRIDVDKRGGTVSHAPPKRAANENSANWPMHFVPNDNPFVGVSGALEEFFAIGLRSPHRMTLDPPTGRIFIGDVGASAREEISVIEPGDPPGLNFQWSTIEGYNGDLPATAIGVNRRPIIDYPHGADGSAIIGGYVYRGTQFPELAGKYIFGDNMSNRIWALDESTVTATTMASKVLLATLPKGTGPNSGNDYTGLSSFGLDAAGELYMCQLSSQGGRIYKLQRGGTASPALPARLSQTGAFTDLAALTPSPTLVPYDLNAPFWSDGAVKTRWAAIPAGATVGYAPEGNWTFPAGSVYVKHFDYPVDDTNPAARRRLETRFLVKTAAGPVYGATYKWRSDGSDADLLDSDLTENIAVAIPPPGNFTGTELGSPSRAGSTTRSGDLLTLVAGGTDIGGTADQGHFASQTRTGDFDMSVRVESLSAANANTKAGLMARESSAAGSRAVFAFVWPTNATRGSNTGGYEFLHRATAGAAAVATVPAAPQPRVAYPNTWLRLRREGDTFIAFASGDGANWTEYARATVALPATVLLGPAATARTTSATTTARVWLQNTRLVPWYYPSRTDCATCHNTPAGGVLGLKARQLNRDRAYANGVTENQLLAWGHAGLFDAPPAAADLAAVDRLTRPDDTSATLTHRARSYVDANCSYCHHPSGVQALWDARFDTPVTAQGILNGALVNNLGITGARVVVPGDTARSVLHYRVNRVGANQMPPLARNQIDRAGAAMLAQWIATMDPAHGPSVQLASPADGGAYTRVVDLALAADAQDSDGVERVEFRRGSSLLADASTAPHAFAWNNVPAGTHVLTAVATDFLGTSSTSTPVSVTVANPPPALSLLVNFQPVSSPLVSGYRRDSGAVFGPRGNAPFYGWTADCTGAAVDRNVVADNRLDTHMPLQRDPSGAPRANVWEVALPNGVYDLRLVAGDAAGPGGRQQVTAEGVVVLDGIPSAGALFVETFPSVEVTDGRLTIAAGPLAQDARLCLIEIRRVTRAPDAALANAVPPVGLTDADGFTLTAVASDRDGRVVRVDFFDGDTRIGVVNSPPFAFTWIAPLPSGVHTLRAVAVDDEGRSTSTAAVSVEVLPLGLRIAGVVASPGPASLDLRFRVPAGRGYTLESSPDLRDWSPVQTGAGTGAELAVPASGAAGAGYYRIQLAPR